MRACNDGARKRRAARERRIAPRTHLASVTMIPNAEKGFEKALLGVRILQSYKVALAKLGQPTRIFRADEYIEVQFTTMDAKGKLIPAA